MVSYTQNYHLYEHEATTITTGSANKRSNTPCIRLLIYFIFRGLEHSYKIQYSVPSFVNSFIIILLFRWKKRPLIYSWQVCE